MPLLNAASFIAGLLLLFVLPGAALAWRLSSGAARPAATQLALVTGLSSLVVPAFHFSVAAIARVPLGAASCAASAVLLLVLARARPSDLVREWRNLVSGWRDGLLPLVLVTAAAAGYQLLFFDTVGRFHFGCTYRACAVAMGLESEGGGVANPSLWHGDHQRLGVTAVLAPAMASFGFFGLRAAWAGVFATLASAGWVVGLRLGTGRAGAFATAVLAGGLPWLAGSADQNRVVLATSALLAVVIGPGRPMPFAAGLVTGLLVAAEPVSVLGAGALAVAAPWVVGPERRFRGWLAFAGGFAVFAGIAMVRYVLAFGHPLFHEHFATVPPLPYTLAGQAVSIRAFLNWPVHDHVVRTSYNALPNLLMVPLGVLLHFGLPGTAAAVTGLGVLAARRPRAWLALLAWSLPVGAFLAVNENWMELDKRDVVLMAYLPLFAGVGAFVDTLVRGGPGRTRATVAALLLVPVLAFGHGWAVEAVVPEDGRLREAFAGRIQRLPPEEPGYLSLDRAWFGPLPWLPQPNPRDDGHADRIAALADELRERSIERRYRGDEPPGTGPLDEGDEALLLDFSSTPSDGIDLREGVLRWPGCAPGPDTVTVPATGELLVLAVDWNAEPLRLELARGRRFQGLMIIRAPQEHERAALERRPAIHAPAGSRCVRVPIVRAPRLTVTDQLSFAPSRAYGFPYVRTEPDGTHVFALEPIYRRGVD